MKLLTVVICLAVAKIGVGDTPDCDNIVFDETAKAFLDTKITENKVFLLGKSDCMDCKYAIHWAIRMGFRRSDIVTENLEDDERARDILDYAYCQYSKTLTFPQVFINHKVVGGLESTRHFYYTGEGAKAAYELESIKRNPHYLSYLKYAAIDFVDDGVKRSQGKKYFVLSKVKCKYCVHAKECLADVGVPDENIEVYEINDYPTHDEIKLYKARLTGSPYTPLLAYNGKVLKDHAALVAATGCADVPLPDSEQPLDD